MSFSLSNSSILSNIRSRFQEEPHNIVRRGYHIELGAREKALLEEDPALKRFKSYKKTVRQASKIGNVLTILAIAGFIFRVFTNREQGASNVKVHGGEQSKIDLSGFDI